MFNPKELLRKGFFSGFTFYLRQESDYRLTIFGDFPSKAINNRDDVQERVNVIKLFDDFWLYIEINFMKVEIETELREGIDKEDYLNRLSESLLKIGKDYFETTITLSVFQGVAADDNKSQLFRAEWDNRLDNGIHPQPHWHICPDLRFIESFNEFVEMIDEGSGFADIIEEEKSKCIDLSGIHFAMNGQWSTQGGHIHRMTDENKIKYWFQGLLGHIKSQLEYVK